MCRTRTLAVELTGRNSFGGYYGWEGLTPFGKDVKHTTHGIDKAALDDAAESAGNAYELGVVLHVNQESYIPKSYTNL